VGIGDVQVRGNDDDSQGFVHGSVLSKKYAKGAIIGARRGLPLGGFT